MAILARTEIKNTGLYAEYWRVLSVNRDMNTDKISARIVAYTDEAARLAGKQHVLSAYRHFDAQAVPLDTNLVEWVYERLKEEVLEDVMPEMHEQQVADLTNGSDI